MTTAITQLLLAAMFGGMLIFSVLFAPLVFARLPAAEAGRFIRAVFPWYYLWVSLLAAVAAVVLYGSHASIATVVLAAAIAVTGAIARWPLMTRINRLRDRQLAGEATAGRMFAMLHRLSVAINLVQLVGAAALIWIVSNRG